MAYTATYQDGSLDYRQMYSIPDSRGPLPIPVVHQNTLMYGLFSDPNVSEFLKMVNKTQLPGVLNKLQGDFTLFVPVNGGIPVEYQCANEYLSRRIVLMHMLEHAVAFPFIQGSKSMLVNTRIPGSRLLVENYRNEPEIKSLGGIIPGEYTTMINRYSTILGWKQFGRGIIYYIDKMILPESNPLTNVSLG